MSIGASITEKRRQPFCFFFSRCTSESELKGVLDQLVFVVPGMLLNTFRKMFRLVVDKLAVVHGQRLQGRDGVATPRTRFVADQRIKRLHQRHGKCVLLINVDAALAALRAELRVPFAVGVFHSFRDVAWQRREDRQTKLLGVEPAAGREHAIADGFRFEATPAISP